MAWIVRSKRGISLHMRTAVIISPNWKDYAAKYLAACLESVLDQAGVEIFKVFLIDNGSSVESRQLLQQTAERILGTQLPYEILASQHNSGFAGGNNLALRQAMAQGFDYAALFNMDGRLDAHALHYLEAAMESDERLGAVQSRLMLWPDKHLINSLGNVTHFLGFGYCLGYRQSYDSPMTEAPIAYASGAAVMFRLSALARVGLFDEEFWMYNEDQDLSWRLWLAGFRLVMEPRSVFFHEYEFSRSVSKYYWMDRNRILAVLKNYHWATLLLIAPAFLVIELLTPLIAWRGGWLKEKLRVWAYFLKPASWRYLSAERRRCQTLRRVSDRSIVKLFSSVIDYQEVSGLATKLGNIGLTIYWRIARVLIFW